MAEQQRTVWCPWCGAASELVDDELAKLREENARLKRENEALRSELSWLMDPDEVIRKFVAPVPLSPDDEAAVRAWFRDREAK